jgi:hypothetical protein
MRETILRAKLLGVAIALLGVGDLVAHSTGPTITSLSPNGRQTPSCTPHDPAHATSPRVGIQEQSMIHTWRDCQELRIVQGIFLWTIGLWRIWRRSYEAPWPVVQRGQSGAGSSFGA